MSDVTYSQACLTPTLGGLGLRRTADHASTAFAASWQESGRTAGEKWIEPPGLFIHAGSQREASFRIDEAIHARLVAEAPTQRERQRLLRIIQPHAGSFITAVPSNEDGTDTVMRPENFRTAVLYRLGVAVAPEGEFCPLSSKPLIFSATTPGTETSFAGTTE